MKMSPLLEEVNYIFKAVLFKAIQLGIWETFSRKGGFQTYGTYYGKFINQEYYSISSFSFI